MLSDREHWTGDWRSRRMNRLGPVKFVTEQLGEQLVVPVPSAARAQWDHELVRSLQVLQDAPRSAGTDDGIAAARICDQGMKSAS